MNKLVYEKGVLKSIPMTDEEIQRLENLPQPLEDNSPTLEERIKSLEDMQLASLGI
jgi:hypothetical protein